MIQRFNILQQSVQEFEASLRRGEKNPFIYVRSQQSSPISAQGDDYVTIGICNLRRVLIIITDNAAYAQMLSEQDYEITLTLIDHLITKGFCQTIKMFEKK